MWQMPGWNGCSWRQCQQPLQACRDAAMVELPLSRQHGNGGAVGHLFFAIGREVLGGVPGAGGWGSLLASVVSVLWWGHEVACGSTSQPRTVSGYLQIKRSGRNVNHATAPG